MSHPTELDIPMLRDFGIWTCSRVLIASLHIPERERLDLGRAVNNALWFGDLQGWIQDD